MIKFIALGGAGDIGASCYYININNTGILVDCGIHPRKKGLEALPKFNLLDNQPLDVVLISHAHQDHIGALPFLIKKYPHVKIYSTPQTKQIASLTLHNAVSIVRRELSADNNYKPYSHEEVDFLVKSINDYPYKEEFNITGLLSSNTFPIMASFHNAGHILGSASILISSPGKKVLFTGDIKLSGQSIMNGASLPHEKIDVLVTESTHGATDSANLGSWENEADKLGAFCSRIINSGGSVLIPVFALGKFQEVLSTIYYQMISGKLISTNIYTGGLGNKVSHVYDLNRYVVERNDSELEIKNIPQQKILLPQFYNEIRKNPSIVIVSSGMMLENTTSYEMAKHWIQQSGFGIAVVGYIDPETPGYIISKLKVNDEITFGESNVKLMNKAIVKKFAFTAHSSREDLLGIAKKMKPESIILIHGAEESRNWMGNNLLKKYPDLKLYSPNEGREISIN